MQSISLAPIRCLLLSIIRLLRLFCNDFFRYNTANPRSNGNFHMIFILALLLAKIFRPYKGLLFGNTLVS